MRQLFLFFVVIYTFSWFVLCEKGKADKDEKASEKWKKKDVRDYTDADVERLYDQWEDGDDEPLEEDELPEWKRPAPKIDLSQINADDPESMLKTTKMGRTLMMFATVAGNPTEKETETITQRWQTSLFNAHYDVQRYVVGADRVLFVLKDGSKAWPVKDFLITQKDCSLVTIEGKDYPGAGASTNEGKSSSSGSTVTSSSSEKSKNKKATTKDKKDSSNIRDDL